MNDNKRRAIVWDTIERLAFRPDPPKKWLGIYAKTLQRFWEDVVIYNRFGPNSEFVVTFLNLKCHHSIKTVSKYEISFVHNFSGCTHWKTHVDPEFLSKASLQTPVDSYPSQQMDKKLHRDVDAVLNGMIFHPRCHTHLEDLGIQHVQLDQERGGLSSHEVRIGGGIENPYVFLFHLRYQFCLVHTDVRRDERQRLIDLFAGSIGRREQSVDPQKLFNFKQ